MSDSSQKSCRDCPSYLDEENAQRFFGKSIGVPMCARYGHLLGKSDFKPGQNRNIVEFFAGRCPDYGGEKPPAPPELPLIHISTPSVEALKVTEQRSPDSVTSCDACTFYVSPGTVNQKIGYPAGVCGKKGRVIFPTKRVKEAQACDVKSLATHATPPRPWLDSMALLPIYDGTQNLEPSPISAFLARKGKPVVEPSTYATDAPIGAEDKEEGIRAWRRLPDPFGGPRSVMMPIFDREHFGASEQAKIPQTNDENHPEWYADTGGYLYKLLVAWRGLDETPILWGQAGVGKTELLRYAAWMMQLPFERVSITKSSNVDDLAGKPQVRAVGDAGAMETTFQYGRVPRAWGKPCILLLDEPNVADDEVWQFLRPLTDNAKQLVLDQNEGELLMRNSHCYLAMAANPAHDTRNIGAQEISDADSSRIWHVKMELPVRAVEEEIIRMACAGDDFEISKEQLKLVMDIAEDIRSQAELGALPISWGIRHNVKVARALAWFDAMEAYKIGAANFLEPEVAELILEPVRSRVEAVTS